MIPEAAVEAAAKAHFELSTNQHMPWEQIDGAYRNAAYVFPMRRALEAAAPHMLAECWDEAIEAASKRQDDIEQAIYSGQSIPDGRIPSPYRTTK